MFETQTLQQVIEQSGVLGTRLPSASGWHTVKCAICNDYKERGGFRFDPGNCSYHCFNCGFTATHAQDRVKFSKNMLTVLAAFQIDLQLAKRVLFSGLQNNEPLTADEKRALREMAPPKVIEIPTEFEYLSTDKEHHAAAIEYVESRKINWRHYGLMTSPTTNRTNEWYHRVIIPIYNEKGQPIFYQGRSYDPNARKRWESPVMPKRNVMFGHHNLQNGDGDTIIVCEGMFDAMAVDGVALLGSEPSPYQLNVLKRSRKTKIVVPQRDQRGYDMATVALENGFVLSFPDVGSAKDINDAVVEYGRLYVEQQIIEKVVTSPYVAQLKLGVWCKT